MKLEEARGVTLLRFPAPAVGVNGKEIPGAKAYTLLHEVIHLMLVAGDEETSALAEKRSDAELSEVERFAEAAASHALVPEGALRDVVSGLGLSGRSTWDIDQVRRVARPFRITPSAEATRMLSSRVDELSFY